MLIVKENRERIKSQLQVKDTRICVSNIRNKNSKMKEFNIHDMLLNRMLIIIEMNVVDYDRHCY